MEQSTNANELYTSKETREMLSVSSSTLSTLVNKGLIERVTPPGYKHGFYTKKSVDEYYRQQALFKEKYVITSERTDKTQEARIKGKSPTVVFREATLDDIEQEAQLARLVFGEKAGAEEERRAFLQANPHTDYHLYEQGKLVAYIDIFPLRHEAIMDFIEGRSIIWNISLNNMKPFEPGKPIECLIADMITSPTIPLIKRVYYGRRLLVGLMKKLVEMGQQGIHITKIYAGSGPTTPLGLRIIRNAEFKEIYRRGEGKIMFELDVMNSSKKFLRAYQEAVKRWNQQHTSHLT